MAAAPEIGRATGVEPCVKAPAGDAAAVLFERYSDRVLRFCLYQLGSREDAEDAMQTTFLHAFRALGRGVVPDAELAWLLKIAENACLTRRRSAARRRRVEVARDLEAVQDTIAAPERSTESVAAMSDALAAMPENQRRAILLREWHGLSYREIGAALDLSQSAVEALMFRARRSFVKERQRLMHGLNFGPLFGTAKSALAGGSAAKLALAAAAITTAGAFASGPVAKAFDRPPPAKPAHRATTGVELSRERVDRPPPRERRPMAAAPRRTDASPAAKKTEVAPVAPATEASDQASQPDPASTEPLSTVPDLSTDALPEAPPLPASLPEVPPLPASPDVSKLTDALP